jgi:anti-sigma factor RsiW
MACPTAPELLEPYIDDELDLARTVEFEKHLASCEECAQKVASLRALSKRLQAPDMRYAAPASLRANLRRKTEPRPSLFRARSSWYFAAAAAMLVLAVLPALYVLQNRNNQRQIARELVGAHVRSLMVDHLIDVQSTDQHTVKPWFEGKIDFAPQVNDYAAQGYPLAGGRLDYIGGRTVAVLVYHRRQHPINVFQWPSQDTGESRPKNQVSEGFNLVHWRDNGMEFWASSDLNYNELAAFVELMRNHRP